MKFLEAAHTDQNTYPFHTKTYLAAFDHRYSSDLDDLATAHSFQQQTKGSVGRVQNQVSTWRYSPASCDCSSASSFQQGSDWQPPCSCRRNRAQSARS